MKFKKGTEKWLKKNGWTFNKMFRTNTEIWRKGRSIMYVDRPSRKVIYEGVVSEENKASHNTKKQRWEIR